MLPKLKKSYGPIIKVSSGIFKLVRWAALLCDDVTLNISSLSDVPPVIATPHHFLISIYRCNIFLVAVITSEGTLCSHCLDWLICEALNLLDLLALKSNNFGSRNWSSIVFLVVSFLLILLRSLYVKKLLLEFGIHLPRLQMRQYTLHLSHFYCTNSYSTLMEIFMVPGFEPTTFLWLMSSLLGITFSSLQSITFPQLVANTYSKIAQISGNWQHHLCATASLTPLHY